MLNSWFKFSCFLLLSSVSSTFDHTLQSSNVLTSNRTIVSENHDFELGFFKLGSNSGDGERWYLGIWYQALPERVREYLWIANRDNPMSNAAGTLSISNVNLVLRDQFGTLSWSSNVTTVPSPPSPLVAELLPNGNFVLRDKSNPEKKWWQSFDFPTDTLLPEMKLGWDKSSGLNRTLTSWMNEDYPSKGAYSLKIGNSGFPQLYIWAGNSVLYRNDPFYRVSSSGVPITPQSSNQIVYNFTVNKAEISYSFRLVATEKKVFYKIKLTHRRLLAGLIWHPTTNKWVRVWKEPNDDCDEYDTCGSNAFCATMETDPSTLTPACKCYQGFNKKPVADQGDDIRCQRKTQLNCVGDGFFTLKNFKLPETRTAIVDKITELKECKVKCLDNCDCTAFATMDMPNNGGLVCLMWIGMLTDLRNYTTEGHDLHVRLAAADIEEEGDASGTKGKFVGIIILITVVIMSFPIFWFWRQKQKRARGERNTMVAVDQGGRNTELVAVDQGERKTNLDDNLVSGAITSSVGLAQMELQEIVIATNNFSNSTKLGEGGFGDVFKGRLVDGKCVAVKRLTVMTVPGIAQFRNEVELIGRLQDVNLVRLLGYCQDSQEHILVYELLENLSLDSYIFGDTEQCCKLNCQKRLEIIKGIGRGLQYLHADSRFRIIHRDMKASNILLDLEMIPKISDFGMARLIGNDESGDKTKVIVGTWGYMAPEYMVDGLFSIKSDVFSFGVLLLETLTGMRNSRFENSYGDTSLLTCVWRNWEEGNLMEIVDSCIVDWYSHTQEILRYFHIGLLCVQELPADRPTMPLVVVLLESEAAIPQPKPPAYGNQFVGRRHNVDTGASSSSYDKTWTRPYITVSQITPR